MMVLIAHNSTVQASTPTDDLCCMSCLYVLACFQSNSTLSHLIKMKRANNNTVMYVLQIFIKGLCTAGINLIIHLSFYSSDVAPYFSRLIQNMELISGILAKPPTCTSGNGSAFGRLKQNEMVK